MKKKLFIDRILRLGIKVCMLSGVAFTFAACYAPAPYREEPLDEYWESQEQLDQRLVQSDEPSAIEEENN